MASMLEKAGKSSAVVCLQSGSIEFRGKVTKPVVDSIDLVARALSAIMKKADG
jgi:hypothetical protein